MLSAEASSAICVQRFDDSRNSAIHTTYRISLRSSSLREPSYPLLRVVFGLYHRLGERSEEPSPLACLQSSVFGVGLIKESERPEPPLPLQFAGVWDDSIGMILPQVHLRKPCYDFSFL